MKNILTSWLFFTSLMLFLIASALVLPELMNGLFGETQQQLTEAVDQFSQETQMVWAEFKP